MTLTVRPDGTCQAIYGEEIDLAELGTTTITRASHVEPDAAGGWTADMRPVDGPTLGPFKTRSEALAMEVAWLEMYRL